MCVVEDRFFVLHINGMTEKMGSNEDDGDCISWRMKKKKRKRRKK